MKSPSKEPVQKSTFFFFPFQKSTKPNHSPDAEATLLWPPDAKSQLIGKDPQSGEDRRQKENRVTEDAISGWHHRLNAHEFEQAPGDGEGQGSLVCCSPGGRKESDTTELN